MRHCIELNECILGNLHSIQSVFPVHNLPDPFSLQKECKSGIGIVLIVLMVLEVLVRHAKKLYGDIHGMIF